MDEDARALNVAQKIVRGLQPLRHLDQPGMSASTTAVSSSTRATPRLGSRVVKG
jgi:hypothetical protein